MSSCGNLNQSGGFTIGKPGVTIRLTSGAIIQNNSPCFIENADNVTITSETLGGGKCVPTSGSDGIFVNAGVQGLRIAGIEIDGTGQTTGDGIHFNGAITNYQIVDNYIHVLDGSAIQFEGTISALRGYPGQPVQNIIMIQRLLLQAVLIWTQLESWGTMAAPTIPDVITAPIRM
jgi:hypothetical protein